MRHSIRLRLLVLLILATVLIAINFVAMPAYAQSTVANASASTPLTVTAFISHPSVRKGESVTLFVTATNTGNVSVTDLNLEIYASSLRLVNKNELPSVIGPNSIAAASYEFVAEKVGEPTFAGTLSYETALEGQTNSYNQWVDLANVTITPKCVIPDWVWPPILTLIGVIIGGWIAYCWAPKIKAKLDTQAREHEQELKLAAVQHEKDLNLVALEHERKLELVKGMTERIHAYAEKYYAHLFGVGHDISRGLRKLLQESKLEADDTHYCLYAFAQFFYHHDRFREAVDMIFLKDKDTEKKIAECMASIKEILPFNYLARSILVTSVTSHVIEVTETKEIEEENKPKEIKEENKPKDSTQTKTDDSQDSVETKKVREKMFIIPFVEFSKAIAEDKKLSAIHETFCEWVRDNEGEVVKVVTQAAELSRLFIEQMNKIYHDWYGEEPNKNH